MPQILYILGNSILYTRDSTLFDKSYPYVTTKEISEKEVKHSFPNTNTVNTTKAFLTQEDASACLRSKIIKFDRFNPEQYTYAIFKVKVGKFNDKNLEHFEVQEEKIVLSDDKSVPALTIPLQSILCPLTAFFRGKAYQLQPPARYHYEAKWNTEHSLKDNFQHLLKAYLNQSSTPWHAKRARALLNCIEHDSDVKIVTEVKKEISKLGYLDKGKKRHYATILEIMRENLIDSTVAHKVKIQELTALPGDLVKTIFSYFEKPEIAPASVSNDADADLDESKSVAATSLTR